MLDLQDLPVECAPIQMTVKMTVQMTVQMTVKRTVLPEVEAKRVQLAALCQTVGCGRPHTVDGGCSGQSSWECSSIQLAWGAPYS